MSAQRADTAAQFIILAQGYEVLLGAHTLGIGGFADPVHLARCVRPYRTDSKAASRSS